MGRQSEERTRGNAYAEAAARHGAGQRAPVSDLLRGCRRKTHRALALQGAESGRRAVAGFLYADGEPRRAAGRRRGVAAGRAACAALVPAAAGAAVRVAGPARCRSRATGANRHALPDPRALSHRADRTTRRRRAATCPTTPAARRTTLFCRPSIRPKVRSGTTFLFSMSPMAISRTSTRRAGRTNSRRSGGCFMSPLRVRRISCT